MTSENCNSLKKTPKIWWLPSNWKALSTVNCKLWLDLTFPRSVVTASTRYLLSTKLVVVNRLHYSSTPIFTSSYWKGTFNRLYFHGKSRTFKLPLWPTWWMTFLVQAYPTAAGYQLGSTCCHGQTQLHCASRAIINYTVDICDSYNSVLEGPLWQQLTKGGTSSPSSTTYPPPTVGGNAVLVGTIATFFKSAHFIN